MSKIKLLVTGFLTIIGTIALIYIGLCIFLLLIAPTRPLDEFRNQTNQEYHYIEIDSVALRYVKRDGGMPSIAFLHGFGSNLNQWNKIFDHFPDQALIAIDSVGFGGSDRPPIDYELDDQANYIINAFKEMEQKEVIVVGHSMGASLAATIAAKEPEMVKGLVMISPSGYPGSLHYSWPKGVALRPGVFNSLCYWVASSMPFQRFFPDSLARQMISVTSSYDERFISALANITQDSLLIWSESDAVSLAEYKEKYINSIKTVEYVSLSDDVGHNINSSMFTISELIKNHFSLSAPD